MNFGQVIDPRIASAYQWFEIISIAVYVFYRTSFCLQGGVITRYRPTLMRQLKPITNSIPTASIFIQHRNEET